jgi:hypothetical protein
LFFWLGVTLVGVIGTVAAVNNARFGRMVRREARQMWSRPAPRRPIDRPRLESLPAPVRTYLRKALGSRTEAPQTMRLQHGGTFRPSLEGNWLPIRGEEYFTADPPGFVWWGRVRIVPGVWIDARDRSVEGAGNMYVTAESTYTLANSVGPELDQGALLRLLGELTWFPTALLDDRYVTWSAVDDRHAKATLALNGREVTGLFQFGDDGLPAVFSGHRYRDTGNGVSTLTPFTGRSSDFRDAGGMLVPHEMVAAWHVDGREFPYARFLVERVEFDATAPY